LHAWLARHAAATAQRFDVAGLRALRGQLAAEQPARAHDLSHLRRASLGRALSLAGDDAGLAGPAFEVFFHARNRVDLFDDAVPALATLSRRWPIVALTNGNADLRRIGLERYFSATVSARDFGVGKPDARIFHEACRLVGAAPHEVLHIGDDWALDIVGAHGAGLRSAWVRRADAAVALAEGTAQPDCVVRDLSELVVWLDR
jgi:putative hydrolase of the HAD superfamily